MQNTVRHVKRNVLVPLSRDEREDAVDELTAGSRAVNFPDVLPVSG